MWKINNFIKKSDQSTELNNWLRENYASIVKMFNFMKAWGGDVSGINTIDFKEFCKLNNLC